MHTGLGFNPNKYINRRDYRNSQNNQNSWTDSNLASVDTQHPFHAPERGSVWFADLGEHYGSSVQSGCRPVMIVSNDMGNRHAGTLVVLPMTTHKKKSYLPSHVELCQDDLSQADPLRPFSPSMLLAEQITTIDRAALRSYLGKVEPGDKLDEIENAVRTQLGIG